MDGDCPPPYGDSPKSKSERLFYVAGRHSRNSSMNSIVGDGAEEDSVELLPSVRGGQSKPSKEAENYSKGNEQSKGPCKVTGSCLCKLSVGFYLATCILISALYVAFYGKSQALFGDAWIPGKVWLAEQEWFNEHCLLWEEESIEALNVGHIPVLG